MAPILIFVILSIFATPHADDRPHGLSNEAPMTISPEAYTFFHPNALQPSTSNPCDSSNCGTLPLAATVQSTPADESQRRKDGGLGAGGVAGISAGFLFLCMAGMGAYRVMIERRDNLEKGNTKQQQVDV